MKMPVTHKSYTALQELVCYLYDGKEVYLKAVSKTSDPKLKSYFSYLLGQRNSYIQEINAVLENAGVETRFSGTLKGKFFIQWMEVKAAFSGSVQENEQVISYCLFSERRMQQAYKEILSGTTFSREQKMLLIIQQQASQLAFKKLQKMKSFDTLTSRFI